MALAGYARLVRVALDRAGSKAPFSGREGSIIEAYYKAKISVKGCVDTILESRAEEKEARNL